MIEDYMKYTKAEMNDILQAKDIELEESIRLSTKKERDFSWKPLLIAFIVAINVIFSAVVLYLFKTTGSEPSTLIISWFAFTTIELVAMAGISIAKVTEEEF